jgi:hypothetical protein
MVNPPHIDIDRLSEAELIDLNRRIVERLKMIAALRSHQQMMKFSVGQRVRFEPPGRGVQEGFVMRYNRKTVTLVTSGGEQWNVAPALLRPAVVASDAVEIIDAPPHKDRP